MLWPKRNSYKEVDNEKKFLRLENSPPPSSIKFSNGPFQKSNSFDKQNNFARISRFFVHFLAVTERL